jgi:predicted branched-subunit amino acid permease
MWVLLSGVGAVFGRLMPNAHSIGLDFLLPIYFLGLVMGFRQRPQWLPVVLLSAVVSILAYTYVGSPWHVSIGAAAGILLAAVLAKPHPPADPEPSESGAML